MLPVLVAGALVLCGLAYAGVSLLRGSSEGKAQPRFPEEPEPKLVGRKRRRRRSRSATLPASLDRTEARSAPAPATRHRVPPEVHAWLEASEPGSLHAPADLAEKLGCSAELGWHAHLGEVRAAFILPGSLRPYGDRFRILIGDASDYPSIQLAKINHQPVPVFTLKDGKAVFEGLFLFRNPTGKFVGCSRAPAADAAD